MKIAIVGQGYVGQALSRDAIKAGFKVLAIDIDESKLDEKLRENPNYEFTSYYEGINTCEVVVIAVPTPLAEDKTPDVSALKNVLENIKGKCNSGTLIVNESTSYPGTLRNLIAAKLGDRLLYAAAPERIDPGNANWNTVDIPRLVAGLTDEATIKVEKFYESIYKNVIEVSSPEVAEAAKLLENTFRQVNIALVNEFAQIAEKFGISAVETINAAATKPFGFMPFMPGIGVGGHCIPVDPSYLSFAVEKLGGSAEFIDLANKVNLEMPKYIAERIQNEVGGILSGKKVQIAGISYKSEVSDLRESPALLLISELRKLGAVVDWHDPIVNKWSGEKSSALKSDIDLGLIITPHKVIDFTPWKQNGVKVLDLSATSQEYGWTKYL